MQAWVDHRGPKIQRLLSKGLKTQVPLRDLTKNGVRWDATSTDQDMERQVSLIAYLEEEGKEKPILIVFQNFKSLAGYNPAVNYVLAVLDFSGMLKTPAAPSPS